MTVDASCYSKDIGIHDDRGWVDTSSHQQVVAALGDLNLVLEGIGLSLLVKQHDHENTSAVCDLQGLGHEGLCTLLEGYRVDDRPALQFSQGSLNNRPVGGVHHHGNRRHSGVAGHIAEERHHCNWGIDQGGVHADIQDLCPLLHLGMGYGQSFIPLALADQPGKLLRACHVVAFPNDQHVVHGWHDQGIQPAQPELEGRLCKLVHLGLGRNLGDRLDMLWRCPTAATHDVQASCCQYFLQGHGHVGGCLGVVAILVGKPRIGVCTDAEWGQHRELLDHGEHFPCSRGAVHPQ